MITTLPSVYESLPEEYITGMLSLPVTIRTKFEIALLYEANLITSTPLLDFSKNSSSIQKEELPTDLPEALYPELVPFPNFS